MSFETSSHGPGGLTLSRAASDFFLLQNRSYPRDAALEWVGNRHRLSRLQRELLHRGVFSQSQALRRRAKRCLGSDWEGGWLVVDGHNVQITIESAILERPLLKGNDGALRDLAGMSARFRLTEVTWMAMDMLFEFLGRFRPREITFLFDAPISRSGDLARAYHERMARLGISGEARAVAVPEREIPYGECIAGSSDQAVLNAASGWIDLANRVLSFAGPLRLTADFSSFVQEFSGRQALSPDGEPFFL